MQHTKRRAVLYLLRNDLRLHDNEALVKANSAADYLIPIYCFDPRHYGSTHYYKFPRRTGPNRLRFLLESVDDLRQSFKHKGSDLILRVGEPETVVPGLIKELRAQDSQLEISVYYQKEVCSEEISVEKALARKLPGDVKIEKFWGHTLFHLDDLPFRSIIQLPDVYTQFRTACEKQATIRPTFPIPEQFRPLHPSLMTGEKESQDADLPSPSTFGFEASEIEQHDPRSAFPFKGGEQAALQRVREYFWEKDLLKQYKETRDGLVGIDYSSKLSPWLALGCLSPRYVHEEILRYEEKRVANRSTYWLFFELLWRDYFKFVGLKYGNDLFHLGGLKRQDDKQWNYDEATFAAWAEGRTGVPWVDSNIRELNATGWMSNRGRQNVASFLTKDLGLDWRAGAEYFESKLIDHDPTSNYGNWTYSAGVGNDPRENRKFNMIKQAKDYDKEGVFVRQWCHELRDIVGPGVHYPWSSSNCPKDYPAPIYVDTHWGLHTNSKEKRVAGNNNTRATHNNNGGNGGGRNARVAGVNTRREQRQQARGWEPIRPKGLSGQEK